MVKEERDKNQLNLQNQAKKFEKEVQDLSEMMKDSKDKLQQSIQEKVKLQGELDNASEFQKKKMDAMHAKLDELLKYTNEKVKDLGLQVQGDNAKSKDVTIKLQEIKRNWLALVKVQNESETTKTLLQIGKKELQKVFDSTVEFLQQNGFERPGNMKDGSTDFTEICTNLRVLLGTLTDTILEQLKVNKQKSLDWSTGCLILKRAKVNGSEV